MTNVILTAPLHEETRGKIRTDFEPNGESWCAYRDGTKDDGLYGYGMTKDEAIADLLEKERTCPPS